MKMNPSNTYRPGYSERFERKEEEKTSGFMKEPSGQQIGNKFQEFSGHLHDTYSNVEEKVYVLLQDLLHKEQYLVWTYVGWAAYGQFVTGVSGGVYHAIVRILNPNF